MIFYTSDLHLGHKNAINLCNRPFSSLGEMDEILISNWNRKVKDGDTVYILGDLIWQSADPLKYLERLKGKKILIAGNHDKKLPSAEYGDFFEGVYDYLVEKADGKTVTFCHYPMLEWKDSRKQGSKKLGYHVHGHIHNGYKDVLKPLFIMPHALNAGADINNFEPVTWDELVKNNETHKLDTLTELVDRALFIASEYHIMQTDRSGKPYVEHPKTVAAGVEGVNAKCVALLHDVLEDTDIEEELLYKYFPAEIVGCVKILTKQKDEDYFTYIGRVSSNSLCREVKLSDLRHNMDLSRLRTVTEDDLKRQEKYKKAYKILSETT